MTDNNIHPAYRSKGSPFPAGYCFGTSTRDSIRLEVRFVGMVITFDEDSYWYDPEFCIKRTKLTSSTYIWTGAAWVRIKLAT